MSINFFEASILLDQTLDGSFETPVDLEQPPSVHEKTTFHLAKTIVHLDERSVDLTWPPDDSTWPPFDLEKAIDE
jgi:hypothetical protein